MNSMRIRNTYRHAGTMWISTLSTVGRSGGSRPGGVRNASAQRRRTKINASIVIKKWSNGGVAVASITYVEEREEERRQEEEREEEHRRHYHHIIIISTFAHYHFHFISIICAGAGEYHRWLQRWHAEDIIGEYHLRWHHERHLRKDYAERRATFAQTSLLSRNIHHFFITVRAHRHLRTLHYHAYGRKHHLWKTSFRHFFITFFTHHTSSLMQKHHHFTLRICRNIIDEYHLREKCRNRHHHHFIITSRHLQTRHHLRTTAENI